MERFDKKQNETVAAAPEPAPTANGAHHDDDDEDTSPRKRKAGSGNDESDMSDLADSPPPKKVKKKVKPEAESDEAFARNLQAEINGEKRATRGGGATKKKPTAKQAKKPKKKSSSKISAADDSDLASGSEKPEKEKKGGFHVSCSGMLTSVLLLTCLQKLMNLSEPLAAMLGQPALSRPQTVKQIWAYVKERDLQDPNDKRQIRCDDAMHAVFKQDKVHMFTMNKLLANHLYPADEE